MLLKWAPDKEEQSLSLPFLYTFWVGKSSSSAYSARMVLFASPVSLQSLSVQECSFNELKEDHEGYHTLGVRAGILQFTRACWLKSSCCSYRNLYKELELKSGVGRTLFSPKTVTVGGHRVSMDLLSCGPVSFEKAVISYSIECIALLCLKTTAIAAKASS